MCRTRIQKNSRTLQNRACLTGSGSYCNLECFTIHADFVFSNGTSERSLLLQVYSTLQYSTGTTLSTGLLTFCFCPVSDVPSGEQEELFIRKLRQGGIPTHTHPHTHTHTHTHTLTHSLSHFTVQFRSKLFFV